MQQEHVEATIRPIVNDALSIGRARGKIVAKEAFALSRLEKQLKSEITRIFDELKRKHEYFDVAEYATYDFGGLERNGARDTMVLALELTLNDQKKKCSAVEREALRALYAEFERRCKKIFSVIHKLEITFTEV